jgi:hypothetical protein
MQLRFVEALGPNVMVAVEHLPYRADGAWAITGWIRKAGTWPMDKVAENKRTTLLL